MQIYYHHVGFEGANRDFPKTVFNLVDISTVSNNIPDSNAIKSAIIATLNKKFPSGRFNCWGVPTPARPVINSLSEGDAVLLVEGATEYGDVPVLCRVSAFWRDADLHELSEALWGDNKYTHIFFFETERLKLLWPELLEQVGYKPNLQPRGLFQRIDEKRFAKYGGAEAYIRYLETHFYVYATNNNIIIEKPNDYIVSPEANSSASAQETSGEEPSTSNNAVTESPEVQQANKVIARLAGKKSKGQGFSIKPAERRAVEQYAMEQACEYYRSQGWEPEDVSKKKPYDYVFRKEGQELRVEVKGTQGEGLQVILTPNEVAHARENSNVVLFIVPHIKLVNTDEGPIVESAGEPIIYQPWIIDNGTLTPLGFAYKISAVESGDEVILMIPNKLSR